MPLSAEQYVLLIALYESRERNGGAIEGNSSIARRLGWMPKKFHRRLETV